MITKHQAETAGRFHENHEPAGKIYVWRRNGKCQTWKTRPADFRLPVKYGLRGYGDITQGNAHLFHAEADCPTRHVRVRENAGAPDKAPVIREWYGIDVTTAGAAGYAVIQVTVRGTGKHRVGSRVNVAVTAIEHL